jgi:hypothetical protein
MVMALKCVMMIGLFALLPLVAGATTNADPFHELNPTFCGANGLGEEAAQLSPAQQKDLAAVCAAYHLGGYEISGSTTHLDVVMLYAGRYNLTVQDIDNETWPNPQTSTFTADMQQIGKAMEPLTTQERESRLAMWREIAGQFFTQSTTKGERVRPSNLLKLERELKKTRFTGH